MQLQEIYELMDRFEKSGLGEMEVHFGEDSLRLKKEEAKVQTTVLTEQPKTMTKEVKEPEAAAEESHGQVVAAPTVGTFYRSAKPGEEPFVKEGEYVEKGQVIGLMEAMKMISEIEAPYSGVIKKILVEDGNFVSAGQEIMWMD